jgi:formylglycine-generating enzyme required for sulfatase activity
MGPVKGERKVYRGGSWFNAPSTLRSANRHKHPTDEPFTNAGVRLVREVEPADSTDRPD